MTKVRCLTFRFVVAAVAFGGIAAALAVLVSKESTPGGLRAVVAFFAAAGGFLLALALVLIGSIVRAPVEQRNDLRKRVVQAEDSLATLKAEREVETAKLRVRVDQLQEARSDYAYDLQLRDELLRMANEVERIRTETKFAVETDGAFDIERAVMWTEHFQGNANSYIRRRDPGLADACIRIFETEPAIRTWETFDSRMESLWQLLNSVSFDGKRFPHVEHTIS